MAIRNWHVLRRSIHCLPHGACCPTMDALWLKQKTTFPKAFGRGLFGSAPGACLLQSYSSCRCLLWRSGKAIRREEYREHRTANRTCPHRRREHQMANRTCPESGCLRGQSSTSRLALKPAISFPSNLGQKRHSMNARPTIRRMIPAPAACRRV